jgi:hypothetical protein
VKLGSHSYLVKPESRMCFRYPHLRPVHALYTKVIAANARDATHVLDGLLYHESDLRIEEHYTTPQASPIMSLRSAICWDFVSRPASTTLAKTVNEFRSIIFSQK